MSKKYVTFIDGAGRNILGVDTTSSTTPANSLLVQNPVMVIVQPQSQGQLQVQLIPLFLSEFVAGDKKTFAFEYAKNQIALGSDFSVDQRILDQYERIMNGAFNVQKPAAAAETPEVIKLFD